MLSLKININVDTGRPEAELSFGSILPYDEEKKPLESFCDRTPKTKKNNKKKCFHLFQKYLLLLNYAWSVMWTTIEAFNPVILNQRKYFCVVAVLSSKTICIWFCIFCFEWVKKRSKVTAELYVIGLIHSKKPFISEIWSSENWLK